jgi:KDO2-lipid IV(A) lauroyltransferase
MAKTEERGTVGKFFYWLRYRVGEYSLRGIVTLIPWIPHSLLTSIANLSARITFAVWFKYPKRMEENLAAAMGEEIPTRAERRAFVLKAWNNFARSSLETCLALFTPREKILSAVRIEGEENLKQAFATGKGVVALSAHLGNFTMIGIALAAAGYPFHVVVKQPRDTRFARLIDHYRARVGIKTISSRPRNQAAREILKALRKNEIVLLIADEFKSGGVEVEFLGLKVFAQRGPITLAMRAGAPLIPMFVTRDEKNSLTLRIESPLDLVQTGQIQDDVDVNVALFTNQLENMVRRYPDQWNWLGFPANGTRPRIKTGDSRSALRKQPDPFVS